MKIGRAWDKGTLLDYGILVMDLPTGNENLPVATTNIFSPIPLCGIEDTIVILSMSSF